MAKATNLQEPEQLLFSFEEEFFDAAPASVPQVRNVKSVADQKPTAPEFLATLRSSSLSLGEFLSKIGLSAIRFNDGWRNKTARVSMNRVMADEQIGCNAISITRCKNEDGGEDVKYCSTLAYFDEYGRLWKADIKLCFDQDLTYYRYGSAPCRNSYCTAYAVGEWTMPKTTKLIPGYHFIQSSNVLMDILEKNYPYTAKWAQEKNADAQCLLLAPHIEILSKAGYPFADAFKHYASLKDDDCTIFNRLCQQGTKPKDIFKTCKIVYSVLKNETSLEIWDCYRKLMKLGKIGVDTIQQAYDQGYDRRDLEYFNSILAKKYNERPVFTWNSLMQYLVRLDTFEAISRHEAFVLLNDYLSMCSQLHMEPRIDGDSLKREHDIAARNCRNRRDEILAERMQTNCERMKRYDYSEGVYFVRGIRDHEDLLDEANQQHNCVASYGSNIANGTSYIYVMREVAHPEKSLITIELSPNGKSIRQKYLAYNQPIHNKSQSEFIERWMKHNRDIA